MSEKTLHDNVVLRRWAELPVIDRAEGIYLWDTQGNRYIDGASGSSVVVNLGHGVRTILDAMAAQGNKVSYAAPHVFTTETVLQLGQVVADRAPGDLKNNCKTWLSVTGTDSTDDAVRLARQYFVASGKPSKYVVISRWQSFHGNNIAVAGFSGHTERRKIYYPMFVNSPHIPPAYCYRCPYEMTYPSCGLKCARELETTIRQIGPENVAAFIAEPVVGAALGAVPAPEGYFKVIRDICDRYDVLFIADEVMTAWGRIGRWFGIEHWGVTPDIIATAKGMTSGYIPLAATIGNERLWKPIKASGSPFMAGHTMNHNPVACAGALAAIQYVEDHNLLERSNSMGAYLADRLQEMLAFDIVGDVRGMGLMRGMEFVKDKATKEPFPVKARASFVYQTEAMKRGLIQFSCTGCIDGVAGDMLLVTPPLVITREEIDETVEIMKDALAATQKLLLG
jgi:adenosylmethionine-8-amino-7-oxononanoate aminotransferase